MSVDILYTPGVCLFFYWFWRCENLYWWRISPPKAWMLHRKGHILGGGWEGLGQKSEKVEMSADLNFEPVTWLSSFAGVIFRNVVASCTCDRCYSQIISTFAAKRKSLEPPLTVTPPGSADNPEISPKADLTPIERLAAVTRKPTHVGDVDQRHDTGEYAPVRRFHTVA